MTILFYATMPGYLRAENGDLPLGLLTGLALAAVVLAYRLRRVGK